MRVAFLFYFLLLLRAVTSNTPLEPAALASCESGDVCSTSEMPGLVELTLLSWRDRDLLYPPIQKELCVRVQWNNISIEFYETAPDATGIRQDVVLDPLAFRPIQKSSNMTIEWINCGIAPVQWRVILWCLHAPLQTRLPYQVQIADESAHAIWIESKQQRPAVSVTVCEPGFESYVAEVSCLEHNELAVLEKGEALRFQVEKGESVRVRPQHLVRYPLGGAFLVLVVRNLPLPNLTFAVRDVSHTEQMWMAVQPLPARFENDLVLSYSSLSSAIEVLDADRVYPFSAGSNPALLSSVCLLRHLSDLDTFFWPNAHALSFPQSPWRVHILPDFFNSKNQSAVRSVALLHDEGVTQVLSFVASDIVVVPNHDEQAASDRKRLYVTVVVFAIVIVVIQMLCIALHWCSWRRSVRMHRMEERRPILDLIVSGEQPRAFPPTLNT